MDELIAKMDRAYRALTALHDLQPLPLQFNLWGETGGWRASLRFDLSAPALLTEIMPTPSGALAALAVLLVDKVRTNKASAREKVKAIADGLKLADEVAP